MKSQIINLTFVLSKLTEYSHEFDNSRLKIHRDDFLNTTGRAVHIHFKIRAENAKNESYEFTSQFFFDPKQIDDIYKEDPYADKGSPDTPNEDDFIFEDADDQLTLELSLLTEEELEDLNAHEELEDFAIETAYQAIFNVGLDLSDIEVGEADSWN